MWGGFAPANNGWDRPNFAPSNSPGFDVTYSGSGMGDMPKGMSDWFGDGDRFGANPNYISSVNKPRKGSNKNKNGGKPWSIMDVLSKPWYGNFLGPGPDADPFTLPNEEKRGEFVEPVDVVDLAAQIHDYAYWQAGATGLTGALFKRQVEDADKRLAKSAMEIVSNYSKGTIDPVTLKPISFKTYTMAYAVFVAFTPIAMSKAINPLPKN